MPRTDGADDPLDALMRASRALVAISAQSLESVPDEVDVTQFRCLVVLASHDAMSLGELAAAASIHLSRASRICDALCTKGLIHRSVSRADRRQLVLVPTTEGRKLIARVMRHRRVALSSVLAAMPSSDRQLVTTAMQVFAEAAGEYPEHLLWAMGWTT